MNKIVLNNGKEINVISANASCFSVKISANEVMDLFNELTEDNLEKIEIKNNDTTYEIITNKCRSSVNYDGEIAIFYLNDVDVAAKKIKELEDTIDTLILSNMGILEQEESEE